MWAAIKYNLGHLGDFRGRDARPTFWYYVLFIVVLNLAVSIGTAIPVIAGATGQAMQVADQGEDAVQAAMMSGMSGQVTTLLWVSIALGIANLVLLSASLVRRLHDSALSGWWAALVGAIHLYTLWLAWRQIDTVQALMEGMSRGVDSARELAAQQGGSLDALLGWIPLILIIAFGVRRGSEGANRFGEEPVRF